MKITTSAKKAPAPNVDDKEGKEVEKTPIWDAVPEDKQLEDTVWISKLIGKMQAVSEYIVELIWTIGPAVDPMTIFACDPVPSEKQIPVPCTSPTVTAPLQSEEPWKNFKVAKPTVPKFAVVATCLKFQRCWFVTTCLKFSRWFVTNFLCSSWNGAPRETPSTHTTTTTRRRKSLDILDSIRMQQLCEWYRQLPIVCVPHNF